MVNKIFLDTNILLDYFFSDRTTNKQTMEFLKPKIDDENTIFVVNNLSFNNLYYIGMHPKEIIDNKVVNKKLTEDERKILHDKITKFINEMIDNSDLWEACEVENEDIKLAIYLSKTTQCSDIEDLQEYISAKNSGCKAIITNDENFPKFDITIIRTNTDNEKLQNYEPNEEIIANFNRIIENYNSKQESNSNEINNNLSEIDQEIQKMLNIPSVDEVVVDNEIKNEKDRNKNRK